LRTEGDINLHADKDFNVYAGGNINMKSSVATTLESEGSFTCANKDVLTLFSETTIGVKSNGALTINNAGEGAWTSSGDLNVNGATINLNGGAGATVDTPQGLEEYTMPDAAFDTSAGWVVTPDSLTSIVTRAPTHEPYPYHNQGVNVDVNLADGTNSAPPGAPAVPQGISITKTA
jgi:hypothetical protein